MNMGMEASQWMSSASGAPKQESLESGLERQKAFPLNRLKVEAKPSTLWEEMLGKEAFMGLFD